MYTQNIQYIHLGSTLGLKPLQDAAQPLLLLKFQEEPRNLKGNGESISGQKHVNLLLKGFGKNPSKNIIYTHELVGINSIYIYMYIYLS